MDQPEPAEDWPETPLSETDAADLLEDATEAIGVWVMDHEDGVRSVSLPAGAPDTAVIDIVVETTDRFEMYSYTGGRWMDYGSQSKSNEEAPAITGTLTSYRLLTGETDLDIS